jgi:hypothetical protein
MTIDQRAQIVKVLDAVTTTQTAIIDKIDEQTDDLRLEMAMQHNETRERATKNADDIQARIIAETNLLRDSVAIVRDQAITIDEHLEGIEGESQETRALLQKVLDVGNKLELRFRKVERFVSRNQPDQAQIVQSLDDTFDTLAEYNRRMIYADPVSLSRHERLNTTIFPNMNQTQQPPIDNITWTMTSTTGHTYMDTVLVSGNGQHLRGDIGIPNKESSKHIFSGKMTISDNAKVVSGNITEPGFAMKFFS